METFEIVFNSVLITSAFWFGFFIIYDSKIKSREREKVEKLFKNKRW